MSKTYRTQGYDPTQRWFVVGVSSVVQLEDVLNELHREGLEIKWVIDASGETEWCAFVVALRPIEQPVIDRHPLPRDGNV